MAHEHKTTLRKALAILLASLCVLTFVVDVNAARRIPKYCNSNLESFYRNNQGHMDAISANPATDLWYQNITVSQYNPVTKTYDVAYVYGYWQSREYNPSLCAFEEVQAWYRGTEGTVLAFQQINSVVQPLQLLVPSYGSGRNFAPQSYDIVWVTNYTADSAFVESSPSSSITFGQGIVQNAFYDSEGFVNFYSMLQTVTKGERRFYVQVYTYASGVMPINIWIDSYLVPRASQPAVARNAFDAWKNDQIPVRQDPNDPSRYVYLYTEPAGDSSAKRSVDPFFPPNAEESARRFHGHA